MLGIETVTISGNDFENLVRDSEKMKVIGRIVNDFDYASDAVKAVKSVLRMEEKDYVPFN